MVSVRKIIADLIAAEPSVAPLIDEHEREYDELLPHVLFGDLARWIVAQPANPRLLGVLEQHFVEGDVYVRDLLLASFVENLLGERIDHLRSHLGPRLRAALRESEIWHPEAPT